MKKRGYYQRRGIRRKWIEQSDANRSKRRLYPLYYQQSFRPLPLLGFIPSSAFRSSGSPAVVIIMLVIAAVLLIGAGLLIFFFVIRKPKDGDDTPPTDDGKTAGTATEISRTGWRYTAAGRRRRKQRVQLCRCTTLPPQIPVSPLSNTTPAPVRTPVEDESRDIYSSSARMPSAPRGLRRMYPSVRFLNDDTRR